MTPSAFSLSVPTEHYMRWTEKVIAAHKKGLSRRPPDRRGDLIVRWENSRDGDSPEPAVEKALELVADGNANESELGFHVLMDLALSEPSLRVHLSQLTHHRSAIVRRDLAFHLSRSFPVEFQSEVYATLLRDKAASVRAKTIQQIGMVSFKTLLPELCALFAIERDKKVLHALNYWIPLLETGYRVDPLQTPGMLDVTALMDRGIASTCVKTTDPNDPQILRVVEELRRRP